ncbi:MAG: hypothetical protein ACI9CD_000510 [Candidatus Deianiraeaceae bacterium]|jgi:uncharacterized protein (TIGR02217 family)
MSFLNIHLPQDLIPHFNKKIQYLTSVGKMQNGTEFRRSIKNERVIVYELFKSVKQSDAITLLENFFHTVRGQMYSFKILDITDFHIQNAICKKIDAQSVQIQKVNQFQELQHKKDITKPKEGTVKIFKDNAIIISGYSVNYQTGVISFNEDVSNSQITVSCEYFHHVRFGEDAIAFTMKGGASFEIAHLTIVEVLD